MIKFKKVLSYVFSMEGSMFRYSLSYSMLLALLPTLIVVIVLFQNFIFNFSDLMHFVYQYIPEDMIEPFILYIMDKNYPSFISLMIALASSIYLSSRSFYSFMLVSATHEKFHTYSILLRIKAFVLFLFFVCGMILLFYISHQLGIDLKIHISVWIFICLFILYKALSFEKRPYYYGLIGALFSTVGIVFVGMLFLKVISLFTSYQNVYGPLGSLVVLLLSIYVISSIIYFGYCLNFEYGGRYPQKRYKMKWFYLLGERIANSFMNIVKKHRSDVNAY